MKGQTMPNFALNCEEIYAECNDKRGEFFQGEGAYCEVKFKAWEQILEQVPEEDVEEYAKEIGLIDDDRRDNISNGGVL